MQVVEQILTDAYVLKPDLHRDERGYFCEAFNQRAFEDATNNVVRFVQDNQSYSQQGTLRGFHFQVGQAAQAKLVRVTRGSALDVIVDVRQHSPTFRKWFAIELSEDNHLQLFVPRGFAHAFVALENYTLFQYKVDNYYSSQHDSGFIWNDPDIAVRWPQIDLSLSEKDKSLPKFSALSADELYFEL